MVAKPSRAVRRQVGADSAPSARARATVPSAPVALGPVARAPVALALGLAAQALAALALVAPALITLALAPPARGAAWVEGLVLTTDYGGPGQACSFLREAPWSVTPDREPLGSDPVGRWHDGLVYVVNRSGDSNLQALDPAAGYATVRQFGLGAGRNPQDIAFGPDGRAWVSCYDAAVLLEVDVEAGAIAATYSTAAFADADGLPETGWMQAVGSHLFVSAQRLDRNNWYAPTGPGGLLVFDMTARAWIDTDPSTPAVDPIVLAGGNPYGSIELSPDRSRLYVPCAGLYDSTDGGVDEVDVAGLASLGYAVTEGELGGNLIDVAVVGPDLAFASVSDASFHTSLRRWNPQTGALTGVLRSAAGYFFTDVAWDGGSWLYLTDRTTGAAGLRVFAVATGAEQTTTALATGLPPASIVLPRDPQLAAAPGEGGPGTAGPGDLRLAAPYPNPANPGCEVRLGGPAGEVVPLALHDLRGRRVRTGAVTLGAAGEASWLCDGRDDRGRGLPSGVYRLTAGSGTRAVTLTLAIVR